MDCCKKFIFIQEDNSLVIELSSTIDEISIFYYGICRCVFEQGVSVEQPMKITNDAKDKIVNFLHHRYSKDKRINKLIQFFRNIGNDQYIYFYPYNNEEKTLEMYDVLEKSLVYYNQGCCQEEIACKIGDYISELSFAKDMLNSMPYTITIIVPGKKVIVGERDKSRRKCIYCGGTQVEENASFKEKAHAIPEALGNKNFIQNEECDICNEYFAENAEEDFSNMLVFNRLKYGLKGKNGYPIFQFGSKKYARFFDWEEEDYEKDWGCFEAVKEIVKTKHIKCLIIIDIGGNKKIDEHMNISYIKDFCPMHAYKTMVKCVIGLIGNDNLLSFQDTIKWLRYRNDFCKLPQVAIVKCQRLIIEPELYIFQRKDETNWNIPYCYGELRVLDQIYVFIIPFCSKDKKEFITVDDYAPFKQLLDEIYVEYKLCDFSDVSCSGVNMDFWKVVELN